MSAFSSGASNPEKKNIGKTQQHCLLPEIMNQLLKVTDRVVSIFMLKNIFFLHNRSEGSMHANIEAQPRRMASHSQLVKFSSLVSDVQLQIMSLYLPLQHQFLLVKSSAVKYFICNIQLHFQNKACWHTVHI